MIQLLSKRTSYKETWKYMGDTFVREGTDEWFTWSLTDERGNTAYLFEFDAKYMELEIARREYLKAQAVNTAEITGYIVPEREEL